MLTVQAWRLVFSPQHLCKEWSMMNPFVSQGLGRWSLLHPCNSLASQPSLIGKRSLTYISTYACVWAHICTQRKYIMHSCTEHRSVSLGTEKWESMRLEEESQVKENSWHPHVGVTVLTATHPCQNLPSYAQKMLICVTCSISLREYLRSLPIQDPFHESNCSTNQSRINGLMHPIHAFPVMLGEKGTSREWEGKTH